MEAKEEADTGAGATAVKASRKKADTLNPTQLSTRTANFVLKHMFARGWLNFDIDGPAANSVRDWSKLEFRDLTTDGTKDNEFHFKELYDLVLRDVAYGEGNAKFVTEKSIRTKLRQHLAAKYKPADAKMEHDEVGCGSRWAKLTSALIFNRCPVLVCAEGRRVGAGGTDQHQRAMEQGGT